MEKKVILVIHRYDPDVKPLDDLIDEFPQMKVCGNLIMYNFYSATSNLVIKEVPDIEILDSYSWYEDEPINREEIKNMILDIMEDLKLINEIEEFPETNNETNDNVGHLFIDDEKIKEETYQTEKETKTEETLETEKDFDFYKDKIFEKLKEKIDKGS